MATGMLGEGYLECLELQAWNWQENNGQLFHSLSVHPTACDQTHKKVFIFSWNSYVFIECLKKVSKISKVS
jgi:hypothetical protein